jgi:hypothetical protein
MPDDQPEPDLATLPANLDKRGAAQLITKHFFPVSYRSLERWPLTWRQVNGRSITPTKDLLAEAQRRFDAAPVIRGGRRAVEDRPIA